MMHSFLRTRRMASWFIRTHNMKFTNGIQTYEVTDQAHIDCFKAKGWMEVKDKPVKKPTAK